MRVMVIVKATKDSEAGIKPSRQLLTDMGAYNQELIKAGIMLAGDGLRPSSQGKRMRFSGPWLSNCEGDGPEEALARRLADGPHGGPVQRPDERVWRQ